VLSFEVEPLVHVLELRLGIVTRECAVLCGNQSHPLQRRLMRLLLQCVGVRRLVALPPPLLLLRR
jgi:hypothetical protein